MNAAARHPGGPTSVDIPIDGHQRCATMDCRSASKLGKRFVNHPYLPAQV
jgi:hypothetical protein